MVLSDKDIKQCLADGRIVIRPIDDPDVQIQPASVDLRLGNVFKVFRHTQKAFVDPLKDDVEEYTETIVVEDGQPFVLHPGEFVLACTKEEVALGDDIVARVEGRSSLGRLALLVHASLPYEEEILFKDGDGLKPLPIGEIVEKKLRGKVLSFEPSTREIGYYSITDWLKNREKRIFKITTSTGREIKLSESHNLFTLDEDGNIVKVPTRASKGVLIAASYTLPNPGGIKEIDLLESLKRNPQDIMVHLSPGSEYVYPTGSMRHYYKNMCLPLEHFMESRVGVPTAISFRQSNFKLPVKLPVTFELAYSLGLLVADGRIRGKQISYASKNPEIINALENYFSGIGAGVRKCQDKKGFHYLFVNSALISRVFECLGFDGGRDIPDIVWNFAIEAKKAFLEGMLQGDAHRRGDRIEYYTRSGKLARKLCLLCAFSGYASSVTSGEWGDRGRYRVEIWKSPHKLMQHIPTPARLLKTVRKALGLTQEQVRIALGYKSRSSISNIENRHYAGVTRKSLQRLARFYFEWAKERGSGSEQAEKLYSLAFSPLVFDKVVEVRDTGRVETTFDVEVFPAQNFLSASSVFLSNTAGYIDPGFRGNVTLELSNVGKMPIALYPGMRICQLSFEYLSSKAEVPYGHPSRNSKYQGQKGPTSSRIHLDKGME
jgi:dCTP deaminase